MKVSGTELYKKITSLKKEHSADIFVYISKTLFWKYPIEGITEVKSKGIDYTFKTKSKKMFETKIYLDISNQSMKMLKIKLKHILNLCVWEI